MSISTSEKSCNMTSKRIPRLILNRIDWHFLNFQSDFFIIRRSKVVHFFMYYLDRKFIVWWIYKRKGEGDGGGRSSSRKKCDIIRRFMIFQFRGFVFRDFRNFFHFPFRRLAVALILEGEQRTIYMPRVIKFNILMSLLWLVQVANETQRSELESISRRAWNFSQPVMVNYWGW